MTETAPTNLIALRDGKQRAEALLSARFAEGLIDQDEFERRLERLNDSHSLPALEQLIVDLVEPGSDPREQLTSQALALADEPPSSRRMVALLSNFEVNGEWLPARRNRVISVLGSTVLDFRSVHLPAGETVIELGTSVLASTRVIVPPGLAVRTQLRLFLGESRRDAQVPERCTPGDPILQITGRLVLASLSVEERLPGERSAQARRRHRQQRRALRRSARRR